MSIRSHRSDHADCFQALPAGELRDETWELIGAHVVGFDTEHALPGLDLRILCVLHRDVLSA